ncbi:MAG: L-fucose:H+ symporter permease [Flavobacteriaceae bacterium]|jgi:FHS family L-fucose permease-like MFS transporter
MPSNPSQYIGKGLLLPFVMVTSLFALWGFANAVTDPMVQAFKKVLELSNTEASWVQMAFYGGYFCMALPAALFVRKYSYKTGILIGLALYATGALLFYPATHFGAFWFFCLALYILTFGLAFLETTANPYILSMGPKATATQRLNLAQSFNPLGLLLGLWVAQNIVLERLQSDDIQDYQFLETSQKLAIKSADLMTISDPYVGLGLLVLFLFLLFSLLKMPRVQTVETTALKSVALGLMKNKKFTLGVLGQMFYVGAQIMCWTYIYLYAEALNIDNVEAANYQFIALILFLVGRWLSTFLLRFISPPKLLLMFSGLAILCSLLTIGMYSIEGLYALVGLSFCMSLMFPTIYGIALESLSTEATKIGAALLVMAIVGGALLPTLQAQIIDWGGSGVDDLVLMGVPEVNLSFVLPLGCFIYIASYAYIVQKRNP